MCFKFVLYFWLQLNWNNSKDCISLSNADTSISLLLPESTNRRQERSSCRNKKKPWEIENINKFSLAMCKDLEWVKWGPTVQQKCLHKKGCETWHFEDEGECKTWDKLGASASEDKFTVASYCVTPQEISH